MGRRRVRGTCHLCGTTGDLSYEHVPPRAAFNRRPVRRARSETLFQTADLDHIRGDLLRRGAGAHTLCGRCNNFTGTRYGPAYVEFAHQAGRFLRLLAAPGIHQHTYTVFPLRVLKQVIAMFASTIGPAFHKTCPELKRFVLNEFATGLPAEYAVFALLTAADRGRASGPVGIGDLARRTHSVFSEITFAPLGFVLALGESAAPDASLIDITFMAKYLYDDCVPLTLALPVLSVYSPLPGDYRTREEVQAAYEENVRRGYWPPKQSS